MKHMFSFFFNLKTVIIIIILSLHVLSIIFNSSGSYSMI